MSKKTILVTGASKGIGNATVRYLAGLKYHILATARSEEPLAALKKSNSRRIDVVPTDLTDSGSIQKLTDFVRGQNMELTAMVHNAGGLIKKPFLELTDSDWNTMWNLNVMSAVRLLRALLPFFGKNAHIVTIGSMGGFQGSSKFPGLAAYSTAKGALSIWTESMATELKEHNISVNCLCLGGVQTGMFETAFPGVKAPVKPDDIGEYIGDFALKGHRFLNGRVIPAALGDP
ncbi:SDR family NAD(P)-dependent oxidoreductase [Balneolales bacterium ANBcel1]|nr:SDR family NAD(P)-dependent oxidoreductase [Balneolales bacterium ANBcel1]